MVDKKTFIEAMHETPDYYEGFDTAFWSFCRNSGTADYVIEYTRQNPRATTEDLIIFRRWLEDRIEDGDLEPIW